MYNNKGFGLIEAVVAIVIIAVLAGAGYIWVQTLQKNDQSHSPEQSNQTSHSQTSEDWKDYHYTQYGLTFKYPASWQVEVTTVEGFEDQPNILIKDREDDLVLGFYGYRVIHNDCDVYAHDVDPQPGLKVDQHPVTVMQTCEDDDRWIGAQTEEDQPINITTNFLGTVNENDARQLLESVTGLYFPVIN